MLPYSGYFSRGVYFADFAERAQFANFETSKLKVGVVNLSSCTLAVSALKKASLLSSSGGPLSRPRHVPSSFVASENKEVRHVIAQCA